MTLYNKPVKVVFTNMAGSDDEILVRNELLCYVQCHVNRAPKDKIVEAAGRAFCDEDVMKARDVLERLFGDKLKNVKLRNRRNGQAKMKAELMIDDIVSAIIELDQNGIKTNFGARDIMILPKSDPKDLDLYAMLQRLMVVEEKVIRVENGLSVNTADIMLQKESLTKTNNTVNTHETLLTEGLAPMGPTYAGIVSADNQRSLPIMPGNVNTIITPSGGVRSKVPNNASNTPVQNNQGHVSARNGANVTPAAEQQAEVNQNRNTREWTLIGRDGKPALARPPQHRRRGRIQGSAESSTLRGAPPPKRDLFISRVHSDTDDEGFRKYIQEKGIQDFDIALVSNENARFKSFKLSVTIKDVDKLMSPEMWPFGVCVQKWRVRRSDYDHDKNTNGATSHS